MTGDPRVTAYAQLSGRDVFPVDDARLASPALRVLWRWWCVAAEHGVPEQRSFDIAEHPSLAPNLYLIERVPRGFRLRLAGEDFVQMFNRRKGHEWRHDAPEPLARAFAGYFDYVVESGRPYHSLGRMRCGWSDWFRFESLICPLRHHGADQLLGIAMTLGDA
jgi:hypothetical protein